LILTSVCGNINNFLLEYKQNEMQNIKNVKMVVTSLKVPFQNFPEEKKETQSRIADLERSKLWMS
jgi:hypothetical protein